MSRRGEEGRFWFFWKWLRDKVQNNLQLAVVSQGSTKCKLENEHFIGGPQICLDDYMIGMHYIIYGISAMFVSPF